MGSFMNFINKLLTALSKAFQGWFNDLPSVLVKAMVVLVGLLLLLLLVKLIVNLFRSIFKPGKKKKNNSGQSSANNPGLSEKRPAQVPPQAASGAGPSSRLGGEAKDQFKIIDGTGLLSRLDSINQTVNNQIADVDISKYESVSPSSLKVIQKGEPENEQKVRKDALAKVEELVAENSLAELKYFINLYASEVKTLESEITVLNSGISELNGKIGNLSPEEKKYFDEYYKALGSYLSFCDSAQEFKETTFAKLNNTSVKIASVINERNALWERIKVLDETFEGFNTDVLDIESTTHLKLDEYTAGNQARLKELDALKAKCIVCNSKREELTKQINENINSVTEKENQKLSKSLLVFFLKDKVEQLDKIEREEAERIAKEERERKAKEKAEAERKAQEEAERKKQEEAERRAKIEAEKQAKAEAARKAREDAERKKQEEADRKAREEAERKAKAEEERRAKEEAKRKAREEAERIEREIAARKTQEEAERKAQEEERAKAMSTVSEDILKDVEKSAQSSYVLSFDDMTPEMLEKLARDKARKDAARAASLKQVSGAIGNVSSTGNSNISPKQTLNTAVADSMAPDNSSDALVTERSDAKDVDITPETRAPETAPATKAPETEATASPTTQSNYFEELKKQWDLEAEHRANFEKEQAEKAALAEKRRKELFGTEDDES